MNFQSQLMKLLKVNAKNNYKIIKNDWLDR